VSIKRPILKSELDEASAMLPMSVGCGAVFMAFGTEFGAFYIGSGSPACAFVSGILWLAAVGCGCAFLRARSVISAHRDDLRLEQVQRDLDRELR